MRRARQLGGQLHTSTLPADLGTGYLCATAEQAHADAGGVGRQNPRVSHLQPAIRIHLHTYRSTLQRTVADSRGRTRTGSGMAKHQCECGGTGNAAIVYLRLAVYQLNSDTVGLRGPTKYLEEGVLPYQDVLGLGPVDGKVGLIVQGVKIQWCRGGNRQILIIQHQCKGRLTQQPQRQ